jgi:hypothetical protein
MCAEGVWVRWGCVLAMSISYCCHTPDSPLFFPEEACEKEVWIVSNLKKIGRRSRIVCVGWRRFVCVIRGVLEERDNNRFLDPRMSLKNREWYRTFALCSRQMCVYFEVLPVSLCITVSEWHFPPWFSCSPVRIRAFVHLPPIPKVVECIGIYCMLCIQYIVYDRYCIQCIQYKYYI